MDFRLLGPIEVVRGGETLDLGPRKQRALLADLCLAAPRVVSTDRLLGDLWGDDADGKQNALWVYVSRLRAALEPDRKHRGTDTVLVTRDHGYALDVDPAAIDVHRFEEGVEHGAALLNEDPELASARLGAALALWRGRPLEEFVYEDFAQAAIRRLDELRLQALSARIDADLRLGRSGELLGELEAIRREQPTDERFVAHHMLALYRSGRHADALRAFERYRTDLADELGLDPSPRLRRLEEQVLLHDDRLQGRHATVAAGRAVADAAGSNPYRGLRPFEEQDAALFFGRERLVADVVRRIDEGHRLVALVGPSGSGKSSVAGAGVVSRVRKDEQRGDRRWLVAEMVPGAHPFVELEVALSRASIDPPDDLRELIGSSDLGVLHAALRVLPPDGRLLLVIDQFEELFTLVDDDEVRDRFLSALVPLADDPHGRVVVLMAIRSDFYGHSLAHTDFGRRFGDGVVNVVPLTPDELETAAVTPALRAGLTFEPALLSTLVSDVVGEPGALPLFQYALTELFERRSGEMLSLDSYRTMGGVHGALSSRAEELFSSLDEPQQEAATQLFLRLVSISDERQWTRRRVLAGEVLDVDVDAVDVQVVIDRYVAHRLLTTDRDHTTGSPTVEVAHEALLTEWPRLRGWIDRARDDVRRHAAMRFSIREWTDSGHDDDYLLTGARLTDYASWSTEALMRLTVEERAYLDASVEAEDRRLADEHRQVVAGEQLARSARRRLWGMAALVLVTAAGAVSVALAVLRTPPRIGIVQGPTGPIVRQLEDGFAQAEREHGFDGEVVVARTDPEGDVRRFLSTGPDLVVLDTVFATDLDVPLQPLVDDHPDVAFGVVAVSTGEDLVGENLTVARFASEEGAFLAGVAAALESVTGVVGFIGASPWSVDDFRAGFEAGVREADPDVTVLSMHLLAPPFTVFSNQAAAQVAASRLYEQGADVILTAAGESGLGAIAAAEADSDRLGRHLWAIGVDTDMSLVVSEAEREHVLTSVLKRHDAGVRAIVDAYVDGTLPDTITLGAGNGGLALSRTGNHVSPATAARTDEFTDLLARGELVVDPAPTGPPTEPIPAEVTVSILHDGDDCAVVGDAPDAVTELDVVTVELENHNDAPVSVGLRSLTRFLDDSPFLSSTQTSAPGIPWAEAIVDPDRTNAMTFRLSLDHEATTGQWAVWCEDEATGAGGAGWTFEVVEG